MRKIEKGERSSKESKKVNVRNRKKGEKKKKASRICWYSEMSESWKNTKTPSLTHSALISTFSCRAPSTASHSELKAHNLNPAIPQES